MSAAEKSKAASAKKQYGQNFLTNDRIPERIVKESLITPGHGVIEIGPGHGILTSQIAAVAAKTVAVEIDNDLIPELCERFSDNPSVTVIQGDILETNIKWLVEEHFPAGMPVSVCANIPYYITSPIILKLLGSGCRFDTLTFMVQKEVAARLTAGKGTPDYSSFTVLCSYYANVRKLFAVPAGCFTPKPKVDSAVIRFDCFGEPPVTPEDKETFFKVIRSAFAYRRKTLVNSLAADFSSVPKDSLCDIITAAGYSATVRGEELDIMDFAAISDRIARYRQTEG